MMVNEMAAGTMAVETRTIQKEGSGFFRLPSCSPYRLKQPLKPEAEEGNRSCVQLPSAGLDSSSASWIQTRPLLNCCKVHRLNQAAGHVARTQHGSQHRRVASHRRRSRFDKGSNTGM
jgi:hypothetical protein